MKKLVLKFIIILIWMDTGAQQVPMYSQYVSNYFLLNPAIAGSNNYTSLRFCSRQQWAGIKGAPSTQVLSMHARIGKTDFYDRKGRVATETQIKGSDVVTKKSFILSGKEAIGGFIFNDKNGPITKTGAQFAYAYHLPFYQFMNRFNKPAQLSIGVSTSLFQLVVDESELTLYDENDPVINHAKQTVFIPDANFGIYFYNTNYYAGFSVCDIFQAKIRLRDASTGENKMVRHYFVMAGYIYEWMREFELEPSILLKTTEITPVQIELTTKLRMKNLSFGLSYRTNNDFVGIFDIKLGRYYFGYSFDYSFGNIITYSNGSHEVILGINIGENVLAGVRDKK